MAMTRDGPFAASRCAMHRRMHVMAVADELGRDVVAREHRAGESRLAMRHRPHAIEEMRRLARAGGDRRLAFLERRAGMSERHAHAGRGERSRQIESAVDLRRERDDADVGAMAIDDGRECPRPEKLARVAATPWPSRRAAGSPQTRRRLRAAEFRIDEVALEMRGQHARAAGGRRAARTRRRRSRNDASAVRRAGDRRRTERRDAPARQIAPRRVATAPAPSSTSVPGDAVHVHVDEARAR